MEEIILAIAEGIASRFGAAVYDSLLLSAGSDQQDVSLGEIERLINDARVGEARSHHQNSARQIGYYKNNPTSRLDSLHSAEVENGYAMSELETICYPPIKFGRLLGISAY